jgi:hypothetical protein
VGREAQVARRLGGKQHLFDRPSLAGGRVAADLRRRKTVEGDVVGGMHGNQLALQMRGQLRELHASFRQDFADVIVALTNVPLWETS